MLIDEIYERMNIEAKAKEKRLYYEYENKIKNEKISDSIHFYSLKYGSIPLVILMVIYIILPPVIPDLIYLLVIVTLILFFLKIIIPNFRREIEINTKIVEDIFSDSYFEKVLLEYQDKKMKIIKEYISDNKKIPVISCREIIMSAVILSSAISNLFGVEWIFKNFSLLGAIILVLELIIPDLKKFLRENALKNDVKSILSKKIVDYYIKRDINDLTQNEYNEIILTLI